MKSILSLLLSVTIIVFGAVADADITQVTTNSYEDILPRIKGNYLVWQGRSNGDWEIFLYNIASGTKTQVTDNDYADVSPQTDGDYIVWQGFDDGEWDIFLWDGTQVQAISDRSAEDTSPAIANGFVVWTAQPFGEDFVGHSEIVLYDAGTQTSTVISAGVDAGNTLDDSGPRISDEAVIWVQADDQDNTTVYMYDLSHGTITENPDYVWRDRPHRDGNLSILTRHDGQDREIFVYDNGSRRYHQVTDNSFQDRYPSISGDYVAWMGGGGKASEVFLLSDLSVFLCADSGGDMDEDSVCGDVDNCPNTANAGQEDSDGDGAGDICDSCPSDANKTEPGICGCGVADSDSDGDGTPDCNDGCEDDPNKIYPGVCGCGVADTDSDGDGTLDCHDGCDDDPNKTEPGICGCGVADIDSDGDGTLDCHDGCNDDANKTEPGVCGCGQADTDSDSDGTPDCTDSFPDDPDEWLDTDADGLGNNADLDDDNDTLPDAWEVSCGLDPLVNDAQDDADHDGYTNLREYLCWTDPSDANSKPQPPVADAGPDQTVGEAVTITLNGMNSSDVDGPIATYFWQQSAGTFVTLSDPWAAQVRFTTPDHPGTQGQALAFELTVTNDCGLQHTSTCIVNVQTALNTPPTADAGADQSVGQDIEVTLDGSLSSDPDDGDAIASYQWIQLSGSPVTLSDATAMQPGFTAPPVEQEGESLAFQLTVTDHGGLQASDTCVVNVTWQNEVPAADAGANQAVDEGVTVTLDGSNSVDADDGIASYLWQQTGGPPVTLSDPRAVGPTFVTPPVDVGETLLLRFQLSVTDNGGLQATDEVDITITDNAITGFPDDVITTPCATDESIGLKVDTGGDFISLYTLDPSTIADATNRPEDLIYGLIDMQIKVPTPGDTATGTIYLATPAPEGYGWYKYSATNGWTDHSGYAVFNAARDQVTLTWTDGGAGDDDGMANGVIVDPSGLGMAAATLEPTPEPTPSPATSDDGGGDGGCFIETAAWR